MCRATVHSNPRRLYTETQLASRCSTSTNRLSPMCTPMSAPHHLNVYSVITSAMRASSDGIYPPAVPLPEEEKTPSEIEAMEAEELMESLSHSKNQEALTVAFSGKAERGKKSEKKDNKLKQKISHVQDAIAVTTTMSRMTRRAERRISKAAMG